MGEVIALPKVGDVFYDVRDDERMMRVSRHDDQGMVVVSLWAGKQCRASFRLPLDELPRLAEALGTVEEPPTESIRETVIRWWHRLAA